MATLWMLVVLGVALPASAQVEAQKSEKPQAAPAAGAAPAAAESGDAEPWYTPTPNFGGNLADQLRMRFEKALPNSPAKQRVACYLGKLRESGSDDRVIWWTRICPTYRDDGSTEEVCGIGDVNEEDLYEQIKKPEDVETQGKKLRIFTYLKSVAFHLQTKLSRPQDDKLVAGELERADRDIQLALEELAKIERAPSNGTDSQRHYLAINAWIKRQQGDPKSVYSCR